MKQTFHSSSSFSHTASFFFFSAFAWMLYEGGGDLSTILQWSRCWGWRFGPTKSPFSLATPCCTLCTSQAANLLGNDLCSPLGWIAKSSGAFTVAPTVLAFPTSQIANSNGAFLPPRHVSAMHEVAIRNGASHAGDVQKQHPLGNTFQTALNWE